MVGSHRRFYGLYLGIQSQWYPYCCLYWYRCPHRSMGYFGPQEGNYHGKRFECVHQCQCFDHLLQDYFYQHFIARAIGLIVIPFVVYLTFFYIHFSILVQSGSGDLYMSPAFQETLAGNEMLLNSAGELIASYVYLLLLIRRQKFVIMISLP